jgi:P-type Cu2+ transporter
MKGPEHATEDQPAAKPAKDEVAKRAYDNYLKEGRLQGHEVQNWLEAEKTLTADQQPPQGGPNQHAHTGAVMGDQMAADFQKRFWISLVLTLPILALSPMLQTLVGLREGIRFPGDMYVLFGFSSAVFWYGGWPFLKGFFGEIRSRQVGMMTLISVAVATAYLYSSAVVFGLAGKIFFWELASLIDIMLLGRNEVCDGRVASTGRACQTHAFRRTQAHA